MPSAKKLITKFALIETFGIMQKALEDDRLKAGTIYFEQKPGGVFYCRVSFEEVEKKSGTTR